ncbi:acid phosphatase-domain-containing protein [Jimgerdemannia flammicorona]|uniref:Acid phosphatase-domain-containing protein n=1 Tax=Jimgerdemannia flammicorona TaxID=994334 RepID=A0A433QZS4_9FUNG|nr:acid phosphatase-domain-containing protein [Jimgerdemannia flammicorona]
MSTWDQHALPASLIWTTQYGHCAPFKYGDWMLILNSVPGPPFKYNEKDNLVLDRAKQVFSLLRLPPTPDHPILTTFADAIAHAEIYPSSKRAHFRTLAEKTDIDYADMIFFDDELRTSEVTRMGVTFVLVNEDVGVTMDVFLDGLMSFGKEDVDHWGVDGVRLSEDSLGLLIVMLEWVYLVLCHQHITLGCRHLGNRSKGQILVSAHAIE